MSRASYAKREREQAKRAKAEAKRLKKRDTESSVDEAAETVAEPAAPADEVLRRLAQVHEDYEAGRLSDEDFQAMKAELLSQVRVN